MAESNEFDKVYLRGEQSVLTCEKCWGFELLSNNFTNIEAHSAVSVISHLEEPERFAFTFNQFDTIESTNDGGAIYLYQPLSASLGWNTFN